MLKQTKQIVKFDIKQARNYVSNLDNETKDNLYNECLQMHSSLELELGKGYSLDTTSINSYNLNSYQPNLKKYEAKKALYERLDNLYTNQKYVFANA